MTFYGSDSGSTVQSGHNQDFYIGKMGAHDETGHTEVSIGPGTFFNTNAIQEATAVYGYWWLGGPGADPNITLNYDQADAIKWGKIQANAAHSAASGATKSANNKLFSDYINRSTIFADVETGIPNEPNHWLDPDTTYGSGLMGKELNGYVLQGFLQELDALGHGVGVYSFSPEWSAIFGSVSYAPSYGGTSPVGWFRDGISCGGIAVTIEQTVSGNDDFDTATSLPS